MYTVPSVLKRHDTNTGPAWKLSGDTILIRELLKTRPSYPQNFTGGEAQPELKAAVGDSGVVCVVLTKFHGPMVNVVNYLTMKFLKDDRYRTVNFRRSAISDDLVLVNVERVGHMIEPNVFKNII